MTRRPWYLELQEHGSYTMGCLLPVVNKELYARGLALTRMNFDPTATLVTTLDHDFNDLFDFDALLAVTTVVHENVHFEQDLYCGVGHLAYQLQCLLDNRRGSAAEEEAFTRYSPMYDFLFFSQSGSEIVDIISRTVNLADDPDCDWSLLRQSSGLDVLETHAALLTYLDLHRRLGGESHVRDFLHDLHVTNMNPTYRRLYDFIRKAVIGQQADELLTEHSQLDQMRILEFNLQVLSCVILELAIHLPPVDTFASHWRAPDMINWLQFHPLYRVAAATGAFNFVMQRAGPHALNAVLQGGHVDFPRIVSEIENLYGWIRYHDVTERWLRCYDECAETNVLSRFRREAMKRRAQNRLLLSQVSERLVFHQEQPLFVKTSGEPIVFDLHPLISLIHQGVPQRLAELWEALNCHLSRQQLLHSKLSARRGE